jgi:hypothetical protein
MPACIAESVTLTAGSVTLSARATAPAGDPRATVLALPAGNTGHGTGITRSILARPC